MKKISLFFLTAVCSILLLSCCNSDSKQEVNIIPQPVNLQIQEGRFTLTSSTPVNIVKGAADLEAACRFLVQLTERSLGAPLTVRESPAQEHAVNITVDTTLKKETYRLNISDKTVDIQAGSSAAVYFAFQTLRQLMPASIESGEKMPAVKLQSLAIEDYPRFAYRGAMLDVCRHIFSLEDIKTYIDILALHKMNRFHWHLTDDQGWRIEIKKYPELTAKGSMRKETVIGRNSEKYDGKPYGGFYTQDEVKEIVKYAADRYITVIPEIELPGHASAAVTSYPWLGCTGGPYEVVKEWGVFEDIFCAGNEKTFQFLEDVLGEVIALFPSEYIHVGGDECPKTAWENCPKCQARIKKEKLKDEHALQGYFTNRIEKYLNSKGRKLIGWDEILEGGISKTATVMSWRGTKGGIEAAQKGNQVIMTPNSYMYLDYYQSLDTENEPFAIGGYVPVEKVYSLEPTNGLSPEEGKMVIGVQGNLWTEYIPDFRQVQYMILPRIAAVAEVGWTPSELKNYEDFTGRAIALTQRYEALGYNYAKHIMSVTGVTSVNEDKNCLQLTLSPRQKQTEIHYTTDGSIPTLKSALYKEPLLILSDYDIRARLFCKDKALGTEYHKTYTKDEITLKKAKLLNKTAETYAALGAHTLTDGIRGSEDFHDGRWVGTCNDDMILIIDLEQPTAYSKINIGCMNRVDDWICLPEALFVYASEDGENYKEIARMENIPGRKEYQKTGIQDITLDTGNGKSRFIKIVGKRREFLPEGHPGEGYAAYLFMDEVEIL